MHDFIILLVIMLIASAVLIAGWVVFAHIQVKRLKSGRDDDDLCEELKRSREKYIAKNNLQAISFTDYLNAVPKSAKVKKIIANVLFIVFTALMLGLSAFAIYLNVNGQQFFLGKSTYVTILTGSMSFKNPENKNYSTLPDNQIEQYALIGIEKSESYEKFDVIAFTYGKTIYVHRIIEIIEQNGVKYYTTMGDANNVSAAFEKNITADRIVGKYTGHKNLPLGYIITVIKSNAGVATLIAVAVFLFGADCATSGINKCENERKLYLAKQLDGEQPDNETDL